MWPFTHKTVKSKYNTLIKRIMSTNKGFQITEDIDVNVHLHLDKGALTIDYDITQHFDFKDPYNQMLDFKHKLFVTCDWQSEEIGNIKKEWCFHESMNQDAMFVQMASDMKKAIMKAATEQEESPMSENQQVNNVGISDSVSHIKREECVLNDHVTDKMKEDFDFNNSLQKHALTLLILRPNEDFSFYSPNDKSSRLWMIRNKEIFLMEDKYENGSYALCQRHANVAKEIPNDGEKTVRIVSEDTEEKDSTVCLTEKNDIYIQIKNSTNKIFICINKSSDSEVSNKLLINELEILISAAVLNNIPDTKDWYMDFIKSKILDDFLSIGETDNYDRWIESSTPGMFSDDLNTVENATSLKDFEEKNGPVKFFKGKINAYPYDDNFWGEFVGKDGKKEIIYVNQGFPFDDNVSDLLNNKQGFGIVEEKDTYSSSQDVIYCLKVIKKRHSMLPAYINERLSFYCETISEAVSKGQNVKAYTFQLYNAITNEILNFDTPYIGVDDISFDGRLVLNSMTGDIYSIDITSFNKFSVCFWNEVRHFRQSKGKYPNNVYV